MSENIEYSSKALNQGYVSINIERGSPMSIAKRVTVCHNPHLLLLWTSESSVQAPPSWVGSDPITIKDYRFNIFSLRQNVGLPNKMQISSRSVLPPFTWVIMGQYSYSPSLAQVRRGSWSSALPNAVRSWTGCHWPLQPPECLSKAAGPGLDRLRWVTWTDQTVM